MNNLIQRREPMHCSAAVARLQEVMDMIGCYLGDIDGMYGPITEKAVKAFQRTHQLVVDGKVGPKTWKAINKNLDAIMAPGNPRVEISDPCLFDFRSGHAKPKLYARPRKWEEVEGVTLHQTGCRMADKPESWKKLNAHIGITRRGECILVNELTDWIWHAQGLSKSTIGIEIEGNYAGVTGNEFTLWKPGGPECHLTSQMIEATGIAFEWIAKQFKLNGQELKHIYAHRQSSNMRLADPGSEIWHAIALPWMEKLGATDGGPGYTRGRGKPIPREWDSKSSWRYMR